MDSSEAQKAFAALAHGSRLEIFRRLVGLGASGLAAGELARALSIPPSSLSFHLHVLEEAGLVRATRRGRVILYAVRFLALRELLVFLTETCCLNRPELCGDLLALLPAVAEPHAAMASGFMAPTFNVLFVCTRNSARSIMAEAILRDSAPERFRAYSAGSDPATAPMAEVLGKLCALGHDARGLQSKSWNTFMRPDAPRMDFVIALCDVLEQQACPDFGGTVVTAAWPLPDPAQFTGGVLERSILLNELYASLRRRIEVFASLPFASLDRLAVRARLDALARPVGMAMRMEGR